MEELQEVVVLAAQIEVVDHLVILQGNVLVEVLMDPDLHLVVVLGARVLDDLVGEVEVDLEVLQENDLEEVKESTVIDL